MAFHVHHSPTNGQPSVPQDDWVDFPPKARSAWDSHTQEFQPDISRHHFGPRYAWAAPVMRICLTDSSHYFRSDVTRTGAFRWYADHFPSRPNENDLPPISLLKRLTPQLVRGVVHDGLLRAPKHAI